MAVDGTPSSSLSRRIFLSATCLPVFLFLPLYTTPYVPVKDCLKIRIHLQPSPET